MKVLVINLLRLGDFLQVAPVVSGIQGRWPMAQVDLLTFKPVQALAPLMNFRGQWWTIDRDELQAGLGQADVPLLTSFDVLKELLDDMQSQSYDLVINLTHTVFAGCITGYIGAKEKIGLAIEPGGKVRFNSPWFRYLDANARIKNPEIFNYTDIFAQACGVDVASQSWPLQPTRQGLKEFEALALESRPTVVCQLFTSDDKKNWPLRSWIGFLNQLSLQRPDWNLVLLASPAEKERVAKVQREVPAAKAAILSLDGALALLQKSDLLVSGDTSIKHLANAAAIKVIELSLGSSDPARTGIYKEDSLILQPRLDCGPCGHTEPCRRESHVCAGMLEPSILTKSTIAFVEQRWVELKQLAGQFPQISFLRTRHLSCGFWFAEDLTAPQQHKLLEDLLERSACKFWLNDEFKRDVAQYGSEGVRLERDLQSLFPMGPQRPLLAHLDFLESDLGDDGVAEGHLAKSHLNSAKAMDVVDFSALRDADMRHTDVKNKNQIKRKLVRTLKSRLMEST